MEKIYDDLDKDSFLEEDEESDDFFDEDGNPLDFFDSKYDEEMDYNVFRRDDKLFLDTFFAGCLVWWLF